MSPIHVGASLIGLLVSLKVWRIVVGISLIPAFATLYQRLTLPESTRFIAAQKLHTDNNHEDAIAALKKAQHETELRAADTYPPPEAKHPEVRYYALA